MEPAGSCGREWKRYRCDGLVVLLMAGLLGSLLADPVQQEVEAQIVA